MTTIEARLRATVEVAAPLFTSIDGKRGEVVYLPPFSHNPAYGIKIDNWVWWLYSHEFVIVC